MIDLNKPKKKYVHKRKYVNVTCSDCKIEYSKREDSLKKWKGRCLPCGLKSLKHTDEERKRMSERARAQVIRQGGIPNAKHFTSERVSGDKNTNWRGGITPKIILIRTSQRMMNWRKEVFKRDNYACVICKTRGCVLNADHIKPFAIYEELRFELSNGRTLCNDCHKEHGARVYGGKIIKEASGFPVGHFTNFYLMA